MSDEQLEWLELSPPPGPAPKKTTAAGAAPCPACGWPAGPGMAVCGHCGQSLTGAVPPDPLAELGLALPAPLVEVQPAPARWFDGSPADPPALYDLRLQAERLRVTNGFDRLICLDDISVDSYQHQLGAALRALRDMRGRALLADEVGLGKTIEAGMVMKELIERGLVASVLIVVPASLTWQWREEMETKFHEEFTVLEELEQFPVTPETAGTITPAPPGRWLISLDRAKAPAWAERLLACEYDLLIVDEAHKLKNAQTQAYRFVNGIRKRYVLLLTATPVHNDLMELYHLVTVLRPGHLGTRRDFRRNFIERKVPELPESRRSARRTIYSGEDVPAYLRRNREEREAYRQKEATSRWIKHRFENFADLASAVNLTKSGQRAMAEIRQLLTEEYEIFDFEAVEWRTWRKTRLDFVCRLKLKAQPARPQPRPRTDRESRPRNPAALRGLLQEIMIRNRRTSVGVRFPPRRAAIDHLNLTPPERALYDGVTGYIRTRLQEAQAAGTAGPLRMTLLTLQKELCSSPQAVAGTLEKILARQPDPQLARYLDLARSIVYARKVDAARLILEQYPEKTLIFTDYLPSLHALRAALTEAGHETVVFHGGMSAYERVEAIRAFRQSARVMISTQSGGEGHNLQFCAQMINYDLPWNPMRIEQRIGRLQRLGQKREVAIFNLSATNTIEAYVLDLLARKIRMFELVIGELDLILGALDDDRSFEDYIEAAWAGSASEAELQRLLAELEKLLDGARLTYDTVREASDELSDLLDAYDEVIR